jgi:hypothetical protein
MTASPAAITKPEISSAKALQKLLNSSGIDLLALLAEAGLIPQEAAPEPVAVKVSPISDEHRAALAKIVEIYGVVAPVKPRKLTQDELDALSEERRTIDAIVTLFGKRKDTSIREAVLNHMDKLAEADGTADGAKVDKNGHTLVKRQVATTDGYKFDWRISDPAPTFDVVALAKAEKAGDITRAQFLALTKEPEVTSRVIDPEKAAKAITKDPSLLAVLAKHGTKQTNPTGSLFLTPNK